MPQTDNARLDIIKREVVILSNRLAKVESDCRHVLVALHDALECGTLDRQGEGGQLDVANPSDPSEGPESLPLPGFEEYTK